MVEISVLGILIGVCGLVGLAIGSFLNVVIYRVPRKESVVSPRSRCPNCGHPIRERDNVPVFSWIVLRGRCRDCHALISIRYPLVELACAGLFAGVAARVGFNWDLPALLVFAAGLLALAVIDVEHLVLPKVIVYPTFLLVSGLLTVDALVTREWSKLLAAAICAVAWYLLFFIMNLASPRILGFGDVRLALVLGLGLGWLGWRYALFGFFAANVIGALLGIVLIGLKKIRRDQPIPYGVFLAIGAALAVYSGPEVLAHFQNFH